MSEHYLLDIFANPLSTATIQEVRYPTNGQSPTNGRFVVRIPDGVSVKNPTGLGDLTSKKYQGLLAFFAGFGNIVFDDLLDVSGLNLAYAGTKGTFGLRNQVAITPGGTIETVVVPLGSTPAQVVMTWELYEVLDVDPATALMQRTYHELPSSPSYATAAVSFNSGATFNSISDSVVLNVPLVDQGNQMVLRITNTNATKRVRVGSWAAIF